MRLLPEVTELRPLQRNLQMSERLAQRHEFEMVLLSDELDQVSYLLDCVGGDGVRPKRM